MFIRFAASTTSSPSRNRTSCSWAPPVIDRSRRSAEIVKPYRAMTSGRIFAYTYHGVASQAAAASTQHPPSAQPIHESCFRVATRATSGSTLASPVAAPARGGCDAYTSSDRSEEPLMRAVQCRKFGPPESLEIVELDDPKPGPGEIVIRVRASAITFPDALMIEDKYQFKPRPPFVPGGDVAGVVESVGEGVTGFAVGDRVSAALGLVGGFAELAKVPALAARQLDASIGFAEATGLLYSYGTGYYALKHRGDLRAGETLLILGADRKSV